MIVPSFPYRASTRSSKQNQHPQQQHHDASTPSMRERGRAGRSRQNEERGGKNHDGGIAPRKKLQQKQPVASLRARLLYPFTSPVLSCLLVRRLCTCHANIARRLKRKKEEKGPVLVRSKNKKGAAKRIQPSPYPPKNASLLFPLARPRSRPCPSHPPDRARAALSSGHSSLCDPNAAWMQAGEQK